MGGVVPLGYRLHIVEDHAEVVRRLFRRYLEIGSVVRLSQIIDAEDLRLPIPSSVTMCKPLSSLPPIMG
jgi:hypothetical protein